MLLAVIWCSMFKPLSYLFLEPLCTTLSKMETTGY